MPAGVRGRLYFVIVKSSFRTDRNGDIAGRLSLNQSTTRVREQPPGGQVIAPAIRLPFSERCDFHKHIPAALFTCLNDGAVQAIKPGLDDTAAGSQRHEPRHTKLGEFFEQEIAAVAFGDGGRDFKPETEFSLGRFTTGDFQGHLFFADLKNPGRVLGPVAVKQADGVAGAGPANSGEVMRLGALENHPADRQRRIDVIPIGHVW